MRISELIAKLQEAMAEHGDLRVDVETDFEIGLEGPTEANTVEVRKDDAWGLSEPSVVVSIGVGPSVAVTTSRDADPD